jgi:hypothetical protein
VRSILWYDWPYLFKHRNQLTCLDNVLLLTRGKPLSLTHLLTAIHPADHIYTGLYQPPGDAGKCIAQIYQSPKMRSAHINYLLQPEHMDIQDLVPLLEGLVKQAGGWGAKQIVADVEINSPNFLQFRQACFSVLAKQTVFRCALPNRGEKDAEKGWRIWSSADIQAMRYLYHTLVPPLVQPVEPLTRQETLGLVYYDEKGNLQAYADLVYGPVGIWVLPVIHPQAKVTTADLLVKMLLALPSPNGRSIYVTSRSYQPWVEHALLDLGGEPGPEQALLVRYLALRQRTRVEFSFKPVENGKREPTLPLAPIENHHD